MSFDTKAHILKVKPAADRLIARLNQEGINFTPGSGGYSNVTFTDGQKTMQMSEHSFYRFSGISVIVQDKKDAKNETECVEVTDDMYMNIFMKPIIENFFKENK